MHFPYLHKEEGTRESVRLELKFNEAHISLLPQVRRREENSHVAPVVLIVLRRRRRARGSTSLSTFNYMLAPARLE